MRFIDEAVIVAKAGNGGNGCISFIREKFKPAGRPDGGDGGNGGSIILVAAASVATLLDCQYRHIYKAAHGKHGQTATKRGKNAEDIRIAVPLGTLIYDAETGDEIGDLVSDGQEVVIARGGRGGLGNAWFASSVRQGPECSREPGQGEERRVRLELKLIADVGLLGLPNAGKSTFIRKVSRSRAKVADYAFTTLTPNLGVVVPKSGSAYVIADVPGLIEGASSGAGLGHQFLRHIERTRVLIHLIDAANVVPPREAYEIIVRELAAYDPALLERPRVVCLNKCDLVDAEWASLCVADLKEAGAGEIFLTSTENGDGLKFVLKRVETLLGSTRTAHDRQPEDVETEPA